MTEAGSPAFVVRRMRARDLVQVERLMHAALPAQWTLIQRLRKEWLTTSYTAVEVADDKNVLGFVTTADGAEFDVEGVYVVALAVKAFSRGTGVGTALLAAFECANLKCVANAAFRVSLHVQQANHDALAFYTSRGFVQEGPVLLNYYRRSVNPNAVFLCKTVAPKRALTRPVDHSSEKRRRISSPSVDAGLTESSASSASPSSQDG
ncbi:hypothetical protein DIPPA_64431 [Diplonema papillatum]|nr:hypothetical protein DIPPA_64431 [Diplonema papillatum]